MPLLPFENLPPSLLVEEIMYFDHSFHMFFRGFPTLSDESIVELLR
jgi:hypothetical protein